MPTFEELRRMRAEMSQADSGAPGKVQESTPAPANTPAPQAAPPPRPKPRALTADMQAAELRNAAARRALGPSTEPSLLEELNQQAAKRDPTPGEEIELPEGMHQSNKAMRTNFIVKQRSAEDPNYGAAYQRLIAEGLGPDAAVEKLDGLSPDQVRDVLLRGLTPTQDAASHLGGAAVDFFKQGLEQEAARGPGGFFSESVARYLTGGE